MHCSHLEELREAPRIPISVNGKEIPYEEIAREIQFHPAPSAVQAWRAAARALIVQRVLLNEAKRKDTAPEPSVDELGLRETDNEALIRQLIEQEVSTPKPDYNSCQRYYKNNRDRFYSEPIFEASHILFKASKSDIVTYATCYTEAEHLIVVLKESPDEFEKLAHKHSDCTSAQQGGNLGQLLPGQTTSEFESALFAMTPGDISSSPIGSPYGIHIIQLHRRIEGRLLPFDAVRDRLSTYLSDRVQRLAIAQYIARLVSAAEISGMDMPNAQDMRVN